MSLIGKYKKVFTVILSTLFYVYVAYFLERTKFLELLFCWSFLFGSFYFLTKKNDLSFKNLALISIFFRLIFLFATPNLSQDFYRFIWDGRMLLEGYNPYLSIPENFIKQSVSPINEAKTLYEGMGILNGSHFTNYPPILQFCFFITAFFSNKSIFGSIIIFRIIIILADIGILYYGKKLLERVELPVKNIFWYVLNPFIIIEMTGNLHFEPVMLLFLIIGLNHLHQQKWFFAGIFMGLAVSVKLIPLLFLPLIFQNFKKTKNSTKLNFKIYFLSRFKTIDFVKLIFFYIVIFTTTVLLFSPFLSQNFIVNYSKTVGLWFTTFEFNASFYYLFREIGYLFRGYNEIAIIGKITAICTIIFIATLAIFKNNKSFKKLIVSMIFGISFYYFFSSTVHPWYVATPLLLGVFTKYKFPIIWTFVVILSYQAYTNSLSKENLWLIALEYVLLYSYIIYEIKKHITKKMIC
ncbi:MAG: mannosyltransferase [Flavobacteriia bacterium]|nr:mannosyltransferase [Flavobacteriia bacterium]OIP47063.1 MAG: mannosyltransferase [Flavobacteriaceae bacterium CG2_30_31_66]PIV97794.1 MAG: mannosyltransferase [Flavobacteriaceae bacterium CG17_big_fil_post_rev_8_21_14_2_50_31_13]PIX12799.1 MAG: mannosyltransferase [Flavobacteriaceae bacterium CG_4_8_14_3_um_filter_31_8]PIY14531.1 MAG: mannosyltransferase [Flavobacteriaceae bacterium CG_4_10_14_3_um_filter_31_253]PIZ11905.1 MAG: mannosyltransferase [Flavobacteriaceae bacterium CG_4_10_14_0_